MEPFLIRFTKKQRNFIRKEAKKNRTSEAEEVRGMVEYFMYELASKKEKADTIKVIN